MLRRVHATAMLCVFVCLFVTYVHIQIGSDGLFSKTLLVPEPPMHVMIPETGR